MPARRFLPLVAALLLVLPDRTSGVGAQTPVRRPNVIVIIADDLGWADLGCYGSTFHESPHLDQLAAKGMQFTQAYSSSPYCSPSRASLMTGRHPARLKITDYIPSNGKSGKFLPAEMRMQLPLEEVTIAEVLHDAGYATWHVGKWHLGDVGFYPQDQGFAVNIAGHAGGLPPSYFWPYGNPDDEAVPQPRKENVFGCAGIPGVVAGGVAGEHLCDRLTSEALKLIAHRKPDQPFFLHLSLYDVHRPIEAKPALVAKYEAKAARLGLPSVKDAPAHTEDNRAHGGGAIPMPDQQVNPVYAAMIETMDTNVGRLMEALTAAGIADDTIMLFTSDNGGHLVTSHHPLRGCKGWLYEGGVRVPLIATWPGVTEPGGVCDVPVTNTDILPTLLEACGLPPQPELHKDGISFTALLRGGTRPVHDALFWHFPHYGNHGSGPCSSIRIGDWKLIEWLEDGGVELFDLAADPSETNDVATRHPDRVQQLRDQLHTWHRDIDANMLRPGPAVGPSSPH
jgi:arylsulfatase A-like enzyme